MSSRSPRGRGGVTLCLLTSGLLTSGVLAACSSGGGDVELAGREFTSTAVSGHTLVDGTSVRLTFEDGIVSAQAGCNTIFGGADWADGVLSTDKQLSMTMMGCEENLAAQDRWLSDFLGSEPALALEGKTLILGDDAQGITLMEEGS